MLQKNQNLLQRRIQGLNQIPQFWVLTLVLGSIAPNRNIWQVLREHNRLLRQQEVKTWVETQVGRTV